MRLPGKGLKTLAPMAINCSLVISLTRQAITSLDQPVIRALIVASSCSSSSRFKSPSVAPRERSAAEELRAELASS